MGLDSKNNQSNKSFVTTCEEAHTATETTGKYSAIKDKLELAAMKGDEKAKAQFEMLDKLPEFAQGIYDTLKENGQNQNVRYTAKIVDKDSVGKDGTVYEKAGDLKLSLTIMTGKDRKLIMDVEQGEDGLKAGYIKAEDKTVTKQITKKDGTTTQVPEKLGYDDFTEREQEIFKLIAPKKDVEREKKDWTKAYETKRNQVAALKDAGFDVYVTLDKKSEPKQEIADDGTMYENYRENITFGEKDGVPAIAYTVTSPKEPKKGEALPYPIEIIVSIDGEAKEFSKIEFAEEEGKFKANKTVISLSDMDERIANALGNDEMTTLKPEKSNVNKGKENFTR